MKRRRPLACAVAGTLMILAPAFGAFTLLTVGVLLELRHRTRHRAVHSCLEDDPGGRSVGLVAAFVGAALLGLAGALARSAPGELALGVQAVVVVLLAALARTWWRRGLIERRAVAAGMSIGFVVLAIAASADAAGWLPRGMVGALGWGAFDGRASLWHGHPNILATVAVLPLIAVVAWGTPWSRGVAAVGALTLVVASGSRTVLAVVVAIILVAAVLTLARTRQRSGRVVMLVSLVGALGGILTLAALTTVLDRFDPRLLLAPAGPSVNLLYGSEDLHTAAWSHLQVAARRVAPPTPRRGHRTWALQKTGDAWWARTQQGVSLPPGASVTLQVELSHDDPEARPGLHARADGPTGVVEATLVRVDGVWQLTSVRGVEVHAWSAVEHDGWTALWLTLVNPTDVILPFALGLTPDQRSGGAGGVMLMRRPQAVLGGPTAYAPTLPRRVDGRTSLGTWGERATWARWAWEGFIERPWFGHGDAAFPAYAHQRTATERSEGGGDGSRVFHAHQLFAQTAFDRGAFGLVGLALFLGGLAWSARRGTPAGPWIVAPVVLMNLTDVTLWTTPVSYLLGLVIGLAGDAHIVDGANAGGDG